MIKISEGGIITFSTIMMKTLSLIFIFIFSLAGVLNASILLDRVAAVVNGEVITWSELRRAMEIENKEQLKGLEPEERERRIKTLEKVILNDLIDLKLQLQEAKRLGLGVSHSEVNGAIEDIKKKYNLTDKEFLDSLRAEGLTEQGYRKQLSEQILLAKVIQVEVRSNIVITDREIVEYYKANENLYNKERVRIRQIFLKKPDDASTEVVEKKAMEIMKRIEQGEDFSMLAKGFSEDPSAESGGDIGYIERGSVLKEIEDVAFSLNKGEVSKPFWSSKGIHIIKVEDRTEGGFEKVKDEIRMVLTERAFQKRYQDWLNGLRDNAYIEINL